MKKKLITFLRSNKLLIAAFIYLLFPIDFIPDFLPAIGMTDDLAIIAATLVYKFVRYFKSNNRSLQVIDEKDVKLDNPKKKDDK